MSLAPNFLALGIFRKLQMFLIGVEMFEAAGYEFIGLDHFAKPDEGLTESFRDGTLQRNFQGMTTGGGLDLIGAGVSSISHFRDAGFLQNHKDLDRYVGLIENVESPVERGFRFTFDDRVRQFLIDHLYAYTEIKPDVVEQQFEINFNEYLINSREKALGEYRIKTWGWKIEDYVWVRNQYIHKSVAKKYK